MALNKTLTELVDMLRHETSTSSNPAVGQGERAALENQINRAYEFYHYDFDWPHLRVRSDKLTSADQRYYDFPTDIDFDRIERVETKWGGSWLPIQRGIENSLYDVIDSESTGTLDPVQRWDVIDVGSGPQCEVWPVPATNSLTIRFTGFKTFSRLVSGSDRAVIDDQLIVLSAAAKLLTRFKAPDAEEAIGAATRRYAILKARGVHRKQSVPSFAGLGGSAARRQPHQIIAVHKED